MRDRCVSYKPVASSKLFCRMSW